VTDQRIPLETAAADIAQSERNILIVAHRGRIKDPPDEASQIDFSRLLIGTRSPI
jgi:hypothetical protein